VSAVHLIGGGPAGVSTAIWLHTLECPFAWSTADGQIGGTLLRVGNPLTNIAGSPAANGPEHARRLLEHAQSLGLTPAARDLVQCTGSDTGLALHWSDGSIDHAAQVVLCTGTRPRLLGLEHEAELLGQGVEISVTRNLARYAGQSVVVAGGGDAALEGALLLAPVCPSITLVHRGDAFRGQRRFVERLQELPNVHLRVGTQVVGLQVQGGGLAGVVLSTGEALRASGLFVRIGVQAAFPSGLALATHDEGYLQTDADGRTSVAGVWAAGDVTGRAHQSVAWAQGQGARLAWALAHAVAKPAAR
jgi:thioredoxin reductase (NADPH)